MEDSDRFSVKRPHITLYQNENDIEFYTLQTPMTTFTELLNAAQCVERNTLTTKGDTILTVDASLIRRRLRNRMSCRKTRLKQKLQQHALEIVLRERQERHDYLTHLAQELGVFHNNGNRRMVDNDQCDKVFRDLTAKSLHYSLVDPDCLGWNQNGVLFAHTNTTHDCNETAAVPSTRKSKRQRRNRDKHVSTAFHSKLGLAQNLVFEQWRSIVDGLQNINLTLQQMHETESKAGVFNRQCYWKFVAVSSAKLQQDGEIEAVAVSGVTHLVFHGRDVQQLTIISLQRKNLDQFDLAATPTTSTLVVKATE
ncbi:uncharacterized protein PHALS_14184 [Plasmopara halstedii]|uniref:BZIP domain-containing protein n=1 Tax=Plasmopara halstedii TaxID=4781 RepID=A0A0N7L6C6_PLAHL|nr:uncharacterized protein PHALS_14184 [Plasmopara halstedii]CEG43899.1 hypothetical protein PHALS_14184 [Plasmopara halstedii]|eukprot:XP_024580268.1 hypothetical protein PHALS_14184 [Plasmopara halstedii]